MAPSLGARKSYRSNAPARPPVAASAAMRVGKSTRSKAEAALRLARILTRQVEVKTLGVSATTVDMLTGATQMISLCDIAQGDGDGTRTGISVHLKRLDLRFRFCSLSYPNTAWRVIVFQDRQTSNVNPVATDLLVAGNTLGQYLPINQDRFKIISDKTFQQNDNFAGQDICTSYQFSTKNFLEGGKIGYSGAAAGTCDHNKLFALVIADYATSATMTGQAWAASEAVFTMTGIAYYTDP